MDEENMTDFSEEELAYHQKLREAEADAVSNILKDGLNTESVVEAAENAAGFAQAMRNKIIHPQSPKIACKSKCHWCCHQSVGVFAPEVFRLTKHIKTNFSSKEQQALLKNIEAIDKNTRGKTPSQRAKLNIPCMFLVYGECLVYEARPLACGRQTSYDENACKKAKPNGFPFGSIESEKAHLVAYNASVQGMVDGFQQVFPTAELEELDLTAAIFVALADDTTIDKWVNGEQCFNECVLNT